MQCRDPVLVLQEKLLDLEHNPADCMWWKHEICSDWHQQRFSDLKHSVPGWVMESYVRCGPDQTARGSFESLLYPLRAPAAVTVA